MQFMNNIILSLIERRGYFVLFEFSVACTGLIIGSRLLYSSVCTVCPCDCVYEGEQSDTAVPALAWQSRAFPCSEKQTVLIWQRGSHLADLMVAPIGSISVCKHRASGENGVYTHKTRRIFYHTHPRPQPSLFYAPMHMQGFLHTHRWVHAPLESTVQASLRASLTGLHRLWVYYSWDVSFFVKKHLGRWIQI